MFWHKRETKVIEPANIWEFVYFYSCITWDIGLKYQIFFNIVTWLECILKIIKILLLFFLLLIKQILRLWVWCLLYIDMITTSMLCRCIPIFYFLRILRLRVSMSYHVPCLCPCFHRKKLLRNVYTSFKKTIIILKKTTFSMNYFSSHSTNNSIV